MSIKSRKRSGSKQEPAGGGNQSKRKPRPLPTEVKGDGARPCPVCGTTMAVQVVHATTLDVCEQHGLWLDRGELERLEIHLITKGQKRRIEARRKMLRQIAGRGLLARVYLDT